MFLVIFGNEPAATNALVEDEAVQAILRMNQKHILPTRNYYSFFNHFSAPKNFPPSHIPPPTS